MKSIYTASRVKHAQKWIELRDSGVSVYSTWIDEAGEGQPVLSELWVDCVNEASTADALLLYVEPGDLPLKGALIEVGAALACSVPVYVVGVVDGSWVNHPLVNRCGSIEEAISEIMK